MKTIEQLRTEAIAAKKRAKACTTNVEKVSAHATLELLVLDIEDVIKENANPELIELKDELSKIAGDITLSYMNRNHSFLVRIFDKVDEFLRLIAIWLILALSSVTVAIPCIILSPLDSVLVNLGVISVYQQIAVLAKRFIAHLCLKCSGIHLVVTGMRKEAFGKECVLTCFSHSSSMDAFLLAGSIPVMALIVVSVD
jgi:hypothetical protein